jgi:hypothetical protein
MLQLLMAEQTGAVRNHPHRNQHVRDAVHYHYYNYATGNLLVYRVVRNLLPPRGRSFFLVRSRVFLALSRNLFD